MESRNVLEWSDVSTSELLFQQDHHHFICSHTIKLKNCPFGVKQESLTFTSHYMYVYFILLQQN